MKNLNIPESHEQPNGSRDAQYANSVTVSVLISVC
jgi:hypothetical protein